MRLPLQRSAFYFQSFRILLRQFIPPQYLKSCAENEANTEISFVLRVSRKQIIATQNGRFIGCENFARYAPRAQLYIHARCAAICLRSPIQRLYPRASERAAGERFQRCISCGQQGQDTGGDFTCTLHKVGRTHSHRTLRVFFLFSRRGFLIRRIDARAMVSMPIMSASKLLLNIRSDYDAAYRWHSIF